MVHGQVVGARGEEGGGGVEVPVVEEGVDCHEEEGGEGGEEGVGLVAVEGDGGGLGGHFVLYYFLGGGGGGWLSRCGVGVDLVSLVMVGVW